MVIIRWPGSKFVPKNGPKNSACEPIYEKSPSNPPPLIQPRPKKSSPARRGYKPIKIIQVSSLRPPRYRAAGCARVCTHLCLRRKLRTKRACPRETLLHTSYGQNWSICKPKMRRRDSLGLAAAKCIAKAIVSHALLEWGLKGSTS